MPRQDDRLAHTAYLHLIYVTGDMIATRSFHIHSLDFISVLDGLDAPMSSAPSMPGVAEKQLYRAMMMMPNYYYFQLFAALCLAISLPC